MAEATFKTGDRVWFISKYGDRVTGTYDRADTIPGLNGPINGHLINSTNAFGPDSTGEVVSCFTTKLHHEQ